MTMEESHANPLTAPSNGAPKRDRSPSKSAAEEDRCPSATKRTKLDAPAPSTDIAVQDEDDIETPSTTTTTAAAAPPLDRALLARLTAVSQAEQLLALCPGDYGGDLGALLRARLQLFVQHQGLANPNPNTNTHHARNLLWGEDEDDDVDVAALVALRLRLTTRADYLVARHGLPRPGAERVRGTGWKGGEFTCLAWQPFAWAGKAGSRLGWVELEARRDMLRAEFDGRGRGARKGKKPVGGERFMVVVEDGDRDEEAQGGKEKKKKMAIFGPRWARPVEYLVAALVESGKEDEQALALARVMAVEWKAAVKGEMDRVAEERKRDGG